MGKLTHGSLFSGYGGIDIAVSEVFGAHTAWVSDIEPGPCRVLEHRFPGVPNLGDITKIDWADVPPVDILSGGSPCQDLSSAGHRAGMTEGTRSNLWVQMREAIATLRPRLVVWENVKGALSARATSELESVEGRVGDGAGGPALRALGRVLGDLAEIGFDAEWATVRASDAGAPHRRARVFLIAWPAGTSPRSLFGGNGGRASGSACGEECGDGQRLTLLPTPRVSSGNGVSERELREGNPKTRLETSVALLPTPKAGDADFGSYAPAIERWERATGRPAPGPTKPSPKTGKPQLSAEFVEWMMGLPRGWFTSPEIGLTRVQALKLGGNGVVPQQAEFALRTLAERASSV